MSAKYHNIIQLLCHFFGTFSTTYYPIHTLYLLHVGVHDCNAPLYSVCILYLFFLYVVTDVYVSFKIGCLFASLLVYLGGIKPIHIHMFTTGINYNKHISRNQFSASFNCKLQNLIGTSATTPLYCQLLWILVVNFS